MLFAIDIGNTNIVLGLYQEDHLLYNWRIATNINHTADEYFLTLRALFQSQKIEFSDISHVIIASVVPALSKILKQTIEQYFQKTPYFINPVNDYGMPLLIEYPAELGADRLVNAIAAYQKFQQSLIIIDFGTATTFDVVSSCGEYLGGLIIPGLRLSLSTLYHNTAKLPKIDLTVPKTVIGKNTVHSMQSGIIFGYSGMINALTKEISLEMDETPKIIATGGLAKLIAEINPLIELVIDDLTLWGLNVIHHRMYQ